MKRLTKQEKHRQCLRELRGTLAVAALCCLWHVGAAFALAGTGWRLLGMPAWFTVSVLGSIIIVFAGLWHLERHVFVDFSYDDDEEGGGEEGKP